MAGDDRETAWVRKRFVPVTAKLAAGTVAIIFALAVAIVVQLSTRQRGELVEAKRASAEIVTGLFAAMVAPAVDFGDREAIAQATVGLRSNAEVTYVAVWTTDASPAAELRLGASPASAPGRVIDSATRVFDDRIEVVRPVLGPTGAPVGSALLWFSLAGANAQYAAERSRMVWLSALVASFATALLLAIARITVVTPLRRLAGTVRGIERGERIRAVVTTNDEIGQLAVAFNAMADAVQVREVRLRELLDHMRQAIVVFDARGRLDAVHSRSAEATFAAAPDEDADIRDLLYPAGGPGREALDAWLPLAFGSDARMWEEVAALAPRRVTLHRGSDEETHLDLEFRPILPFPIARIMLLATDVTQGLRLEKTVQAKDRQHARELAALRRLLAGGAQLFSGFVGGVRERLDRCESAMREPEGGAAGLDRPTIDRIFREAHSIHGEARALGLLDVAEASRELEDVLGDARIRGVLDADAQRRAREHVGAVRAALARAEAAYVEASPIGAAVLDQVSVMRPDLDRLVAAATRLGGEIDLIARRLAARPFGELVVAAVEAAPGWAEAEGKRARIDVIGRDEPVDAALGPALRGAITHVVRNAIAHGIESTQERTALGKDEVGAVTIRCEGGPRPTVTITDDGRGVDRDALLASAARAGVHVADAESAAFVDGVSTRSLPDALAGRGVGLPAARAELAGQGYGIRLSSRPGAGARVVIGPEDPSNARA